MPSSLLPCHFGTQLSVLMEALLKALLLHGSGKDWLDPIFMCSIEGTFLFIRKTLLFLKRFREQIIFE